MKEYTTKDIANIVGIATPTVRKFAQILEKNGYNFMKNDKGNRIFFDSDIAFFQEIKERSNDTGMNVDNNLDNSCSCCFLNLFNRIFSASHFPIIMHALIDLRFMLLSPASVKN